MGLAIWLGRDTEEVGGVFDVVPPRVQGYPVGSCSTSFWDTEWDPSDGLWVSQIDDVIVGGATGTEILMGLRFVLGSLVESGECDSALTDRAAALRRASMLVSGGWLQEQHSPGPDFEEPWLLVEPVDIRNGGPRMAHPHP